MSSSSDFMDHAGALLGQVLALAPERQEAALAALCTQHPEYARSLRAGYASMKAAGLVDARDECPMQVGPYRVVRLLGQGGMGRVLLAEEGAPLRRQVAVKVIRPGIDTDRVLQRFALEQQALAAMDHDHIAKVLGAGSTGDGRPYFAMEFVQGVPLDRYCDDERLDVAARLRLFADVCAGVQHAHQKGVIHRDLKPSNILVTNHGGRAVPKVIDFGLARASAANPLAEPTVTRYGQILGTPEYMSPEQAGLGSLDIDTRTDVYSLGVILYDLLVGELPFERREYGAVSWSDLERRVREELPCRPSARISRVADEASARRRRCSVAALVRTVRGDLDWIVMRALEKDRARRYPTPLAFADDIARHLANKPVHAGPTGVGYRLRKYVRRRRGICTTSLGLLIVTIAGTAVAQWQAGVASSNLASLRRMSDAQQVQDLEREADCATRHMGNRSVQAHG